MYVRVTIIKFLIVYPYNVNLALSPYVLNAYLQEVVLLHKFVKIVLVMQNLLIINANVITSSIEKIMSAILAPLPA